MKTIYFEQISYYLLLVVILVRVNIFFNTTKDATVQKMTTHNMPLESGDF